MGQWISWQCTRRELPEFSGPEFPSADGRQETGSHRVSDPQTQTDIQGQQVRSDHSSDQQWPLAGMADLIELWDIMLECPVIPGDCLQTKGPSRESHQGLKSSIDHNTVSQAAVS